MEPTEIAGYVEEGGREELRVGSRLTGSYGDVNEVIAVGEDAKKYNPYCDYVMKCLQTDFMKVAKPGDIVLGYGDGSEDDEWVAYKPRQREP
jgi:hypothetical protein